MKTANDFEIGPWDAFFYKANAITLQRLVVPWLVALYGMKYAKPMKLDMLKEMVIALSPSLDFVRFDVKTAAEEFPVGITDISEPASSYVPVCEFEIHMCIYIDFEYIHI